VAIKAKVATVTDEVPAVMADFNAVMTDISAVGEGRLGLGSNSGEEEANGE
jgi:hypothetical protein